jgi:hypothetical protein
MLSICRILEVIAAVERIFKLLFAAKIRLFSFFYF